MLKVIMVLYLVQSSCISICERMVLMVGEAWYGIRSEPTASSQGYIIDHPYNHPFIK